jgi:hypothetical protein
MPEQYKKAGTVVIVARKLLLVLALLLLLLQGRNVGLREFVTEAWLIAAVEPQGAVAVGEGYMLARRWAKTMSYLSMRFMLFFREKYCQVDRSTCWDHLHQNDAV